MTASGIVLPDTEPSFPVELAIAEVRLPHRRLFTAYLRDLTAVRLFIELQEKSRLLAEASQHKSRFLAAASHDLRQPMQALGLFVAQLRDHIASAEGSRLVDRIDAGALTPTIAEFPIAELLGRIGSTFAAVAEEKGLALRLVSSSAWVRSDPVLLERIVLNLVSNAVRYTTSGGIVV